jgi:hypothetical protein
MSDTQRIGLLRKRLAAMTTVRDEAIEVLQRIEWAVDGRCPDCFRVHGSGRVGPHAPDCDLARIIGAAKETTP